MSLQAQLEHLTATGQTKELIGKADLYVPSTPNSLYVPLHARRVLGHDNVWFSQAGARLRPAAAPLATVGCRAARMLTFTRMRGLG